ncbi:hypothetical protein [Sporolactobacillus terrae]|uniref:Uncharacterized protein n=1 Tax=Sporolactobacillus terrae TaxID=269673 RepID=A0A410DC44_9BACL|nr:hypothetical protein [Sporolactobacillus terrae]QAA23706.1 hypothetical protein C0674_14515 [Sporolactobacillus terrae]QAA26677.1 hypothetical protein C0679_14500 [Sporolactobacillus terrae]UAK15745.1 hypothetical protein K7399_12050 [Sporolactobacillus terrae]BBO00233.1 hypothetical protein St703_29370 [Sporolactobacillus terrae]
MELNASLLLDFNQKLAIIESFSELEQKKVSLGRLNFQYNGSATDKKNVVYHLHPNGNGYVYAKGIDGYDADAKGMVNIRDFSEEELRELLKKAIFALSPEGLYKRETANGNDHELWVTPSGRSELEIVYDNALWNVYAGDLLDGTFRTYKEAVEYLTEEGFVRK